MTGKIKIAVLGLGISLGCFAGEMGTIQKSGFYLQAMLDYNWFHYNNAYTASFFGHKILRHLKRLSMVNGVMALVWDIGLMIICGQP